MPGTLADVSIVSLTCSRSAVLFSTISAVPPAASTLSAAASSVTATTISPRALSKYAPAPLSPSESATACALPGEVRGLGGPGGEGEGKRREREEFGAAQSEILFQPGFV